MNTVFFDMDGVLVDFDGFVFKRGIPAAELKKERDAYIQMKPLAGGIEALKAIAGMGYKTFLATKPPTGIPWAWSDKYSWVLEHIPEWRRRVIITPDKGVLGDAGDFLIDDRPERANCMDFKGQLFTFRGEWELILMELSRIWKMRQQREHDFAVTFGRKR